MVSCFMFSACNDRPQAAPRGLIAGLSILFVFVSPLQSASDSEPFKSSNAPEHQAGARAATEKDKRPPSIDRAWDTVFRDHTSAPDSSLIPQTPIHGSAELEGRIFFRYAVEYRREEIFFTGQPTQASVIDAAEPRLDAQGRLIEGFPFAFEPNDQRLYSDLSIGTRYTGANPYGFYFSMRYRHDADGTTSGSPFAGILDTFGARRRAQVYNGYFDWRRLGKAGPLSQMELRIGRQSFFGAEPLELDGARLSFSDRRYDLSVFVGRRFSYWSDPIARFAVGADIGFRVTPFSLVRYQHTYYVRNSHLFSWQQTHRSWAFDAFFKMLNADPVDLSVTATYAPPGGSQWISLNYFRKLTDRDFFFDFVDAARVRQEGRQQFFVSRFIKQRNLLGQIPPYNQFYAQAHRRLLPRLAAGASVAVRRLDDEAQQTSFLNSFDDVTAGLEVLPLRRMELTSQYRVRNIRRRNPDLREECTATIGPPASPTRVVGPCDFDTRGIGERRFHEILAEASLTLNARIALGAGGFFRSYSTQGSVNPDYEESTTIDPTTRQRVLRFTRTTFNVVSQNVGGVVAHVRYRLDPNSSIRLEYGIDRDFSFFYPDIDRVQAFRIRYEYNR